MEEIKFIIKYFVLGITILVSGSLLTKYIRIKYFNK